jgi:hypothetical protein
VQAARKEVENSDQRLKLGVGKRRVEETAGDDHICS